MKNNKTVTIVARFQFKGTVKVVYVVRSSDGIGTYETSLNAGHATGCTCKSKTPCYHMVQLEANERQHTANILATPETVDLFSMTQEQLAARRIAGEKKQKQLKRAYQKATVEVQKADREHAVLARQGFSILKRAV